jgi:hypothetical protein
MDMKMGRTSLADAVSDAWSQRLHVPGFQRGLAWRVQDIRRLLASVIAGQPIGSWLFAKRIAQSESEPDGAVSVPLDRLGKSNPRTCQWLVLDGQQRVLSLMFGFRLSGEGLTEWVQRQPGSMWEIDIGSWVRYVASGGLANDPEVIEGCLNEGGLERCADETGRMVVRRVSWTRWIYKLRAGVSQGRARLPLGLLIDREVGAKDTKARALKREVFELLREQAESESALDALEQVRSVVEGLEHYRIPIVRLSSCSLREANSIFDRINRSVRRLSTSDLVFARVAGKDRELREAFRSAASDSGPRALVGMAELDVLKIAVCASAAPGSSIRLQDSDLLELAQDADGIERLRSGLELWMRARHEVGRILEERCGIASRAHWPLASVAVAGLSAWAYVHREGGVAHLRNDRELRQIFLRWWWRQSANERNASASNTTTPRLFWGLVSAFEQLEAIDPEPLPRHLSGYGIDIRAPRRPGSVASRWTDCLLRSLGLSDFGTGNELRAGGDSLDLHHIFPQKWLELHRPQALDSVGQSYANLTFIQAETNRGIIGGKSPSKYVEDLVGRASPDSFARMLLVHGVRLADLQSDDFEAFVEHRAGWFDEIAARLSDDVG